MRFKITEDKDNTMLIFFKKLRKILSYIVIILPLVFFALNYEYSLQVDWSYFNSLAHYAWPIKNGHLQFADLNICGGVDNFANPQMWYFSPFNIVYLLFGAHWGNIVSWYVCSFIGFYYFSKISSRYLSNNFLISLFSLLFVLASFFSLHFWEGHIVFRTFFLIPLIYYYATEKVNEINISVLVIVLTLMILDGGIYPFFFSLVMLPFVINLRELKWKYITHRLFLTTLFACFLTLLSKAIPVFSLHADRIMQDDPETYSLKTFFKSIYFPFFINWNFMDDMKYRAHEYAQYIGIGVTLIIFSSFKTLLKTKEFYISLLFLWIASGVGGDINPWSIIKSIPYLQQIHVQSRFLILFYFFLLVSILKVSDFRKKYNKIFIILAVLESLCVTMYISSHGFDKKEPLSSYSFLSQKNNIKLYDEYITKPAVYGMNKISHGCYEPAIQKKIINSRNVFFNTTPNLDPMLGLENNSIIISLKKELQKPLLINMNWNAGWECENCDIEYNEGIIQLNTLGKKEYKLTYKPFYSPLIFLTWIIGVIVGIYGWKKYKNI